LKLIHSCEPITNKYESQDITLTLPGDLTVYDINWLSMWCETDSVEFGHIDIPKDLKDPKDPKDLNVPPYRGKAIKVSLIPHTHVSSLNLIN
jgi:Electron transfer DM13